MMKDGTLGQPRMATRQGKGCTALQPWEPHPPSPLWSPDQIRPGPRLLSPCHLGIFPRPDGSSHRTLVIELCPLPGGSGWWGVGLKTPTP